MTGRVDRVQGLNLSVIVVTLEFLGSTILSHRLGSEASDDSLDHGALVGASNDAEPPEVHGACVEGIVPICEDLLPVDVAHGASVATIACFGI